MSETLITTANGRLALTVGEIGRLQSMLDAHDRGAFYMTYYEMTGSGQAYLQANVSTFSGPVGAVAFAANRLGQVWGSAENYPGIYKQSQHVAQFALDAIKDARAAEAALR